MEPNYAKGMKPRDLDAAKGGPTLERVRSFTKDAEQELGPPNKQDYAKGGGDGDEKRTGDKSLPAIKPRS